MEYRKHWLLEQRWGRKIGTLSENDKLIKIDE